jgi:hypothetical protein
MVEHRLKILGINVLTLEVTNQLRAYLMPKMPMIYSIVLEKVISN